MKYRPAEPNAVTKKLNLRDSYYNLMRRFYNFETKIHLREVDFSKSWLQPILKYWRLLLTILIIYGLAVVIDTVSLVWLAQAISAQNIYQVFWVLGLIFASSLIKATAYYFNSIFQNSVINSVYVSAAQLLLTVDPINHISRDTGSTIAKAQKGSAYYERILDTATFFCFPFVVQIVSIITLFLTLDIGFGLMIAGCFVLIGCVSAVIILLSSRAFDEYLPQVETGFQNILAENISQVQYIRATFSTELQQKRFLSKYTVYWKEFIAAKVSREFLMTVVYVLFMSTTLLVSGLLLWRVQTGVMSLAQAIGFFGAFFSSSYGIVNVGYMLTYLLEERGIILDMYRMLGSFGQNTFPVLSVQPNPLDFKPDKIK